MARHLPSLLLCPLVAALSFLACGGSTGLVETDSGSGGSASDAEALDGLSTGGDLIDGIQPMTGGADGGGAAPSSGGTSDPGPSTGGCCTLLVTCDEGDTEISSEADCPEGASCYSKAPCCDTVWCIDEPEDRCNALATCTQGTHEVPTCTDGDVGCAAQTLCGQTIYCAVDNPPSCGGGPMCPEGTREVGGCPGEGDCSVLAACGVTIYCLSEASACAPELEYNRKYVANGASACEEVDFSCEEGTTPFENKCGCGCVQPEDCPEWVDCMPSVGGEPEPLCSSNDCPYTLRAY